MDISEDMGIMNPLIGTVHRSTYLVGFWDALLGTDENLTKYVEICHVYYQNW